MSAVSVSSPSVVSVQGAHAGGSAASSSSSSQLRLASTVREVDGGGGHLQAPPSAPSSRRSSLSYGSSGAAAGEGERLTPPPSSPKLRHATLYAVDHAFDPHLHWYPRALNAQLHPMVDTFLSLGNTRMVERFCHLNPAVQKDQLTALLHSQALHFPWSGADLFNVTNSRGKRQMIVVETNSCPSGQKSMPSINTEGELDGYHTLIRTTFQQRMEAAQASLPAGGLAVIYDKNDVEASGYAAAMVDVFHEQVYLAELHLTDGDPPVVWRDGVMHVRDEAGDWHPIRAAFRYVTQKPWQRIPLDSRTLIINPVLACLAGGRNKMIADKAYEFFNNELSASASGLAIRTPETVRDVSKTEIPLWVHSMGGHAVIKVPYSNAGQGVFTITNADELHAFMQQEHHYDKFIVQSLVGNASWSSTSRSRSDLLFHAGTLPNKRLETFVCDLRCMITSTQDGFQPIAVYARRALLPLKATITSADDSWKMLGTNLSIRKADGGWTTDTSRLLLMDSKDFNRLGIAIDDLIEAYVQTVLSTLAIDRMARRLTSANGSFDRQLYRSLNNDPSLLAEILQSTQLSNAQHAEAPHHT